MLCWASLRCPLKKKKSSKKSSYLETRKLSGTGETLVPRYEWLINHTSHPGSQPFCRKVEKGRRMSLLGQMCWRHSLGICKNYSGVSQQETDRGQVTVTRAPLEKPDPGSGLAVAALHQSLTATTCPSGVASAWIPKCFPSQKIMVPKLKVHMQEV